ncbi:hypothetical protein V8C26DRAFT_409548 [Trichoderma gracile]
MPLAGQILSITAIGATISSFGRSGHGGSLARIGQSRAAISKLGSTPSFAACIGTYLWLLFVVFGTETICGDQI